MQTLRKKLDKFIDTLNEKDKINLLNQLKQLVSIYPFNEYEFIIANLFDKEKIKYDDYLNLRDEYLERNRYLYLYEMAPRTFGEVWGEKHLKELIEDIKSAENDTYDLLLDDIKIEVKATRFVEKKSGSALFEKALYFDEIDNKKFLVNFQQLKPTLCDVFIWIGVFKDKIIYWVLSNEDVKNNKYFSSQHRQEEKKTETFEGQIILQNNNFNEFEKYRVSAGKLYLKIKEKNVSK